MHGSMRRGLETEHPAKVTAVKRPAGETRGKVAAGPKRRATPRASPRPYILIWRPWAPVDHGRRGGSWRSEAPGR